MNAPAVRNYTLFYDKQYKLAHWVAYPMYPACIGNSGRTNKWAYDPGIAQNYQPNLKKGWGVTQYDRGHQLPSGDRTNSKEANASTFYYTNMTAQNASLNRGQWENLERQVRTWTSRMSSGSNYDTLFVVTGAILPPPPEPIRYIKDNSGAEIAVPKAFYKALAQKINGKYYTIGFYVNNETPASGLSYNTWRVTVADLERKTGFTFFPRITAPGMKEKIDNSAWN
jgi:endonuclease G